MKYIHEQIRYVSFANQDRRFVDNLMRWSVTEPHTHRRTHHHQNDNIKLACLAALPSFLWEGGWDKCGD